MRGERAGFPQPSREAEALTRKKSGLRSRGSTTLDSDERAGFTLVELMVSIFGFTLIVFGVIALVSGIFTNATQQGNLLAGSDQARKLSYQFASELRNAQYSNTGSYPLGQAADQQIVFYTNLDGGQTIERVRYFISNGKLYKGVVAPSGSPLSYNLANEKTTVVQDNVGNGATPLFYYYDGNYSGGGTPLAQPISMAQVKFVKMNLLVLNKGGVSNTNTYTVTAGAAIRNLKTNLGQ